jgi:hypothetical protein
MVLHDAFVPPLKQGRYVVEVSTTAAGLEPPLPSDQRHFDVVGPRFGLAPADVAGCYPPKDAKGPFMDALPHVALGRRTLPWEILLDPKGRLPAPPPRRPGEPDEPAGEPPWMALLLLEETEIVAVKPNRKLSDVLPRDVLADLGAAPDTQVTSLAVDRDVLFDVLPTVEEMKLLTHVREVNVDDRELSAGDSDGFFAVVMSNRVPVAGRKYRACLVSLEGRSDVLRNDDPEVERTTPLHLGVAGEAALLEGRVPPVAASAGGGVAEPLASGRPSAGRPPRRARRPASSSLPAPSRGSSSSRPRCCACCRWSWCCSPPGRSPARARAPSRASASASIRGCSGTSTGRSPSSPTPGTSRSSSAIAPAARGGPGTAARWCPSRSPATRAAPTTPRTTAAACRSRPAWKTSPTPPRSRWGASSPPPTRASPRS